MITAIFSAKGGVGKTATSINLASCLYNSLLVDIDPQGACGISLGINVDELPLTVYDALLGKLGDRDAILHTGHGFDLLPANIDLAQAELQLAAQPGREYALKRALREIAPLYMEIVIDTPPTLGLLTINALAAADSVLIPVSTQLLSLRGLTTLLETIEKIRRYEINPELSILGILPTKYDSRTIHGRQVMEYLSEFGIQHDIKVFPPIRATVRFDEATNEHVPFVKLYPDDEATYAYKEISRELQKES